MRSSTRPFLSDLPASDLPALWVAGLRAGDPRAVEAGDRLLAEMARNRSRTVTVRQLEMLRLAADGATYKQIAAELWVTVEDVKSLLGSARLTLEARNTTHAVAVAIRAGLI